MATKCDWNYYDKHGKMFTAEEVNEMGECLGEEAHIRLDEEHLVSTPVSKEEEAMIDEAVKPMDEEDFEDLLQSVKEGARLLEPTDTKESDTSEE